MLKTVKKMKNELIVRKIGAGEARIQNNTYRTILVCLNDKNKFFVSLNIKKGKRLVVRKVKNAYINIRIN